MRLPRLLALCAVALALVSCGRTGGIAHDGTLHVALTEYRLAPKNAVVPPGLTTITIRNYGRLTHNLAVTFGGHIEAESKPIPPGQVDYLTLELQPGTYTLASTLFSDQALGTVSTLRVKG
jgi:hypothetical protein